MIGQSYSACALVNPSASVRDDEVERQRRDRPRRVHLVERPEALDLVRRREHDLSRRRRHVDPPMVSCELAPVTIPNAALACRPAVCRTPTDALRHVCAAQRTRRCPVSAWRTAACTAASSAASHRRDHRAGAARHGRRRRTRRRPAAGTPTPSSSATPPTSSTAARAPTASCGGPGSRSTPASAATGRWCGRCSSPTSTPTTSWTWPTSSWGAGRRTSIDVYGPAPGRPADPGVPARRRRPLVFPDEPTPGHRARTRRPPAAGVRLQHQPPRRRRGPRQRRPNRCASHEIGVRRDGYVARHRPRRRRPTAARRASAAPPMEPVVIYPEDDHGVQVSAVLVQHAPVFPAFGFRVRHAARLGGVLGRHRRVRQRRAAGRKAPTCSSTR